LRIGCVAQGQTRLTIIKLRARLIMVVKD